MKYNNNETKELQQFITPIWYSNQPELLYLDSNCDKYIDESIAKHGRKFGISNHSDSLTEDKNFKPLTDLVGKMSIDF